MSKKSHNFDSLKINQKTMTIVVWICVVYEEKNRINGKNLAFFMLEKEFDEMLIEIEKELSKKHNWS